MSHSKDHFFLTPVLSCFHSRPLFLTPPLSHFHLRPLFLSHSLSCFHLRPLFLTPSLSCFQVSEPLTRDHPLLRALLLSRVVLNEELSCASYSEWMLVHMLRLSPCSTRCCCLPKELLPKPGKCGQRHDWTKPGSAAENTWLEYNPQPSEADTPAEVWQQNALSSSALECGYSVTAAFSFT